MAVNNPMERHCLLAALAEMGYTNPLHVTWVDGLGWAVIVMSNDEERWPAVPRPVAWMATELIRPHRHACWPCCKDEHYKSCVDGKCRHPTESRYPPRELLEAR